MEDKILDGEILSEATLFSKFFSVKTIWLLFSSVILVTLFVDMNVLRNPYIPMYLYAIPYCFGLFMLGLAYKILFKNKRNINSLVNLIVQVTFCLLVLITIYLEFSMLSNRFSRIELGASFMDVDMLVVKLFRIAFLSQGLIIGYAFFVWLKSMTRRIA